MAAVVVAVAAPTSFVSALEATFPFQPPWLDVADIVGVDIAADWFHGPWPASYLSPWQRWHPIVLFEEVGAWVLHGLRLALVQEQGRMVAASSCMVAI